MDDANLLAPGTVWVGVSMVSWHGDAAKQLVVPVFDGSMGITLRVQIGANLPRSAGQSRTQWGLPVSGALDLGGLPSDQAYPLITVWPPRPVGEDVE